MALNRSDLVRRIADDIDMPAVTVDRVLGGFFEVVTRELAKDETIALRRFGRFEPRRRNPVERRNPSSGEVMKVGARRGVGFVASDYLKQRLNRTGRGR